MGVRRERPPSEQSGSSLTLRFPDGTTRTMPVNDPRGPVAAELCCFCGQSLPHSDPERVRLSVAWLDGEHERTQSWGAHHACVVERLHESVAATGPFFGD